MPRGGFLHKIRPESERFWSKVDTTGGPDACWIWRAHRNVKGYGRFRRGTIAIGAHRFAYETLVGVIPPGLQIDHLCSNTGCVNPKHLEIVTGLLNTIRARLRRNGGDCCPHGHAYTPANTIHRKSGKRECRACKTQWDAEYSERTKIQKRARSRDYYQAHREQILQRMREHYHLVHLAR